MSSDAPKTFTVGPPLSHYGTVEQARKRIELRRKKGIVWRLVFYFATTVAIAALAVLLLNIVDGAFGYVAYLNTVEPATLSETGQPLEELSEEELVDILEDHLSSGLLRRFEFEQPLDQRTRLDLQLLVEERVVEPRLVGVWNLFQSLFQRNEIIRYINEDAEPGTRMEFRSWLTLSFITSTQAPDPQFAGVRTAILGTLWMLMIVVVVTFPLGVGSAIYLEEYAQDNRLNRLIQVNIYNLSGVPSIIYGLLGLAVFVRILGPITSGQAFGAVATGEATGRTILSAGLTLSLLVLPIVIISSQEAIRAVPSSIRESSYGLGATKWQTIWYQILPASFDRILTGSILAVSRAVGDTATLIMTGAATVIFVDPDGIFSQFTALPIQIYQWSARPQGAFRNVAAAAIIVLLVLLLTMNTFAILTRDRIRRRRLM
ncbi:MAG: phosphate ABC transporter permease PstA [Spirochaetaceae bacterium]